MVNITSKSGLEADLPLRKVYQNGSSGNRVFSSKMLREMEGLGIQTVGDLMCATEKPAKFYAEMERRLPEGSMNWLANGVEQVAVAFGEEKVDAMDKTIRKNGEDFWQNKAQARDITLGIAV